jgi:hypothetical protein
MIVTVGIVGLSGHLNAGKPLRPGRAPKRAGGIAPHPQDGPEIPRLRTRRNRWVTSLRSLAGAPWECRTGGFLETFEHDLPEQRFHRECLNLDSVPGIRRDVGNIVPGVLTQVLGKNQNR